MILINSLMDKSLLTLFVKPEKLWPHGQRLRLAFAYLLVKHEEFAANLPDLRFKV